MLMLSLSPNEFGMNQFRVGSQYVSGAVSMFATCELQRTLQTLKKEEDGMWKTRPKSTAAIVHYSDNL